MEPNQAGGLEALLPLILIAAGYYFVVYRPRKKKQEELNIKLLDDERVLEERLNSIEQRLNNIEST